MNGSDQPPSSDELIRQARESAAKASNDIDETPPEHQATDLEYIEQQPKPEESFNVRRRPRARNTTIPPVPIEQNPASRSTSKPAAVVVGIAALALMAGIAAVAVTSQNSQVGTDVDNVLSSTTTVRQLSVADAAVYFEDFAAEDGMKLVGSAKWEDGAVSLTRKQEGLTQSGAAWYPQRLDIENGFEALFAFRIDHVSWYTIGDGFAFVIQNTAHNVSGDAAAGNGYETIPNSVAIEFDTVSHDYKRDPRPPLPAVAQDAPMALANHVSIHTAGTDPNESDRSKSIGWAGLPILLADRLQHVALIRYSGNELSVFVDNDPAPAVNVSIDLASTLNLTDGTAFVGFTAGTEPGYYSDHRILAWAFNSPCLLDDC
jgi:hypothetical protein